METVQYKCPNCGGSLEFDAAKQGFGCEYCLSFFTETEIKQIFKKNESMKLDENVAEVEKDKQDFAEHVNLYTCPNCGAEVIADDTTSATTCHYCHNPVILSGRLSGDYKPAKLIAFKLDKNAADEVFKNWSKKKWFLPKSFKTEKQLEKLAGVYVPFWIADCSMKADMDAIGKRIRTWRSGDYIFTETKEYSLVRNADVFIDDLPADGSKKIEDALMEAIEPFDYNEMKPFSMSFLSGFLADKYDVDKAGVFPRIKQRAVNAADSLLRSTMKGYDSVVVTNADIRILQTDWSYVLLPVWFMNYMYKGKIYSFAINGQTGKLAGKPPLSLSRLFGFCGALAVVIAIISAIVGYFIS